CRYRIHSLSGSLSKRKKPDPSLALDLLREPDSSDVDWRSARVVFGGTGLIREAKRAAAPFSLSPELDRRQPLARGVLHRRFRFSGILRAQSALPHLNPAMGGRGCVRRSPACEHLAAVRLAKPGPQPRSRAVPNAFRSGRAGSGESSRSGSSTTWLYARQSARDLDGPDPRHAGAAVRHEWFRQDHHARKHRQPGSETDGRAARQMPPFADGDL